MYEINLADRIFQKKKKRKRKIKTVAILGQISSISRTGIITLSIYLAIAHFFRGATDWNVYRQQESFPSLFTSADLWDGKSRLKGPKNLLYCVHTKYHMPQELHHPPTLRITLFRVDNPLAYLFVIAQRPLQNTLPRDCELCATSSTNLGRSLIAQPLRV